ncbi:MAG: PKD domain-containing protein [Planctomycetota bacterium]
MFAFAVCAFTIMSACNASPVLAQFNPPILVSTGGGEANDPAVNVGTTSNGVLLSFVEDGHVFLHLGPDFVGPAVQLTTGVANRQDPQVLLSLSGFITVVFEQQDTTPGALGDEIFYVTNPTGPFGPAGNLSQSLAADSAPRITSGSTLSARNIAWISQTGGVSQVLVSRNLGAPEIVADGTSVAIEAEPSGILHLVYERAGGIYYRRDGGTGFSAEVTIYSGASPATTPSVESDFSGNAHIVYARDGDIFYRRREVSGALSTPLNLTNSPGVSAQPQILVGATGIKVLYTENADIWQVRGAGIFFLAPENLTNSPAVSELDPAYVQDNLGYLHICYVHNGDVYYRNNVLVPSADFVFTPVAGEYPLEVEFTNTSTGVIDQYSWDFGDGATSTLQNPVHTYQTTGTYTVTLEVQGAGGGDTLTVPNAVQVTSATNFMIVPPIRGFQGQPNVTIPVIGTHPDPIQGFQVAMIWDCDVLNVTSIGVDNTRVAELFPEFVVYNLITNPDDCYFILGVIFDFGTPFDGRTLDPGVNQRLCNLYTSIKSTAPVGTTVLDLHNGLSVPPIFNIFTVAGISVLPVLVDGVMIVEPFTFPPPLLFLRGDFNQTVTLEITDAINMLDYLFQSGNPPNCADAADVNDSGALDVSDVIYLLSFLFAGGEYPPFPFPSAGMDPTPDPLGDCSF